MASPAGSAPAPAAVLFDLDGTLVDSRRDLAAAVNRTREHFGRPALGLSEIVAMVGEGARNLVARAFGLDPATGEPVLAGPAAGDLAPLDEVLARFYGFYGEGLLDSTLPYPGIPRLLGRLAGRLPLAVVTNKPESFSRRILAGLDLSTRFAVVVGGDSLPARKPDPVAIHRLAERFAAAPGDLLLVGDSRIDAETAAAGGCRLALVEWGFTAPAELAELAARHRAELVAADAASLGRHLLGQPLRTGW